MRRNKLILRMFAALALSLVFAASRAADWLPITQEELRMSSEPKASAASAIYLYRQVDRIDDGPLPTQAVYSRIKILTEEGRKYADVQIPYSKSSEHVRGIEARTIRPDGTVTIFDGTIFEKPLVEGRGTKVLVKAFTLPDVQVGGIIEYRYRIQQAEGYVYHSHWMLSEGLFTKYAKFSLVPYRGYNLHFSWPAGLPPGTEAPKTERDIVRLESRDIPAFVKEDHMPPEDGIKFHVDFIYTRDPVFETDPVVFWKQFGKASYRNIEKFVDQRRVMEQAVAQIVASSDSSEIKVRKIYARTQQLRNLSFEREKTTQENNREGKQRLYDIADVWKRGYGDDSEISWLFLGLVRAAGIEADAVLVSTRDKYFFNQRTMNQQHLNTNVVVVKLEGKELYLDPGTPFTPFGLLPWPETGVSGLRLDKNGGTWIDTPLPPPSDSRIERKATLRLTASGLEGKVTVTYTGLEALWRRLEERNEDDTERKEFLENQIEADIPTGIEVTLTNKPDWSNSETPLVAEYDLQVPGWASQAGQRELLTIGLFGNREKSTFKYATRVHPLYFNFPSKTVDDITIDLPPGLNVSSVPQAQNTNLKVVEFASAIENKNTSLHITRELAIDLLLLDKKFYPQLRDFFQKIRTSDEEQIVLTPSTTSGRR